MGTDQGSKSVREGKDVGDIHDKGGVHGDSHSGAEEHEAGAEPTVGRGGPSGPDPDDPQEAISEDTGLRKGEGS